jgi:hypothetical protein
MRATSSAAVSFEAYPRVDRPASVGDAHSIMPAVGHRSEPSVPDDPSGTARGVLVALLLCAPFWAGVLIILLW